jgi:hypothetical protein
MGGTGLLNRYNVKCSERVNQEDKAQDDPNDLERLAFDEHSNQVINEIENECRDK